MDNPIADELVEELKTLPHELQWRVLEFTRPWRFSLLAACRPTVAPFRKRDIA